MTTSDLGEAATQFLQAHYPDLVRMTLQAYKRAGGHYMALAAEAQELQAQQDAQEWLAVLLTGAVDPASVEATAAAIPTSAMLHDVVEMVAAQDMLFAAFVKEALPAQPALARELATRMHKLTARFRMNLSALHMMRVVQRPPDAPPA